MCGVARYENFFTITAGLSMAAKTDLTDEIFRKISKYVYEICGINLTERKRELVNTRIGKVIREKNLGGFKEYYKYLIEDETGDAVSDLMNAISTNLTSFFREPKHFDFLREVMYPQIIEQAKKDGRHHFRAWSAGCSTGAEIYTIAMTLFDSIPDISQWDAKLLATDIDTNVLNTGTNGIYHETVIKDIPKHIAKRYLQRSKDGKHYRVKAPLRHLVAFRYLNLIEPFPLTGKFDFIFCRNVMIYFDNPTQQKLIDKFSQFLKHGGCLFIGHSEGLSSIKHDLKYIRPTIYQKK